MQADSTLLYITLYLLLELNEMRNQRGDTLREILEHNRALYNSSYLYFFMVHAPFFFMLFLLFSGFLNIFLLSALIMKGLDITLKLYFIGKLQQEDERVLESEILSAEIRVNNGFKLLSSSVYIILIALGVYHG